MRTFRLAPLFLSGLLTLSACGQASRTPTQSLTVFAASSLTDAFNEIGMTFEAAHPGGHVQFSYGASSQLATQINEGAPADIFASANSKQVSTLQAAGHIEGEPVMFVTNKLVVIVPADNPAQIKRLADLGRKGIKLILAAKGVPVRDYTDQIMTDKLIPDSSYGQAFANAFYANVVSEEENVRQVVSKIGLGEGDAAIVYASDVTPDLRDIVTSIKIPDEMNVIAAYPIARIKGSANGALAQEFVAFVLSDQGQAILQKWGFGPAPK
jgi:molybdate transport system substrate-binding protein